MKIYCSRSHPADEALMDSLVGKDIWIKICRTDHITPDYWYVRVMHKEPINLHRVGLGFKFHGYSYEVWAIPASDIDNSPSLPLDWSDDDIEFSVVKFSLESADVIYPKELYTTQELFGKDLDWL